ncbi:MAG: M42 family metallopeptidase [candidate division Zixibacteria bacterium]|nr:M42 family metallopeptidase [candidate division Zixibacteria bacterium]
MDNTQLLLQEITEANGVSGYEGEVRKIMRRELDKYADNVETDKMGSIIGSKTGTDDDPRVMVIGHLDEVGFMVKEITPEGYIKFLALGGWWGHVALGQRMRIITSKGPVLGVIGSTPPHLLEPKDREKVLKIKEMFIDVGCQEKFDVKKKLGIKVGDPIVPDSQFTVMGNPKMYMSKAFDNRMGCAVAIDVLKKFQRVNHPNTILAGASVQEEVGLRGAQTVAHLTDPDVCIIVDTGIGQDIPPKSYKIAEKMGGGPAILIFDACMIPNLALRDLVIKTAKDKKIPHHLTYMEGGCTDGARVHMSRIGVPTIVIGPPVRYIHSHNGILNRTDYDNTVKLICELIKKLNKKTVNALT